MVHAAETREQARGDLIDRWEVARQAKPDKTRMIFTHTNDEVRTLNEMGRDKRREAGELGDDARVKTANGDQNLASGNRVMFRSNERSLEVKNGTLGTVERVNEQGMTVRTDDGRSLAFELKDYRDLDHGYAATIHKTQAVSVDRTHALATPGMDRHGTYVVLTRRREGVDSHYGRDDFKDDSRLVRILSRERAKEIASNYRQVDPAKDFAERRGISFSERVAEIVRPVVEKARGIFDGLRLVLPGQDRAAQPPAQKAKEPVRHTIRRGR